MYIYIYRAIFIDLLPAYARPRALTAFNYDQAQTNQKQFKFSVNYRVKRKCKQNKCIKLLYITIELFSISH